MTVIDLAVICLMAICVVIGVGEPLARRWSYRVHGQENGDDTERLSLQKEMLYGAIRDLDFDFQTGKVDQKDYAELRQQLEREAAQILRQLDAADPLVRLTMRSSSKFLHCVDTAHHLYVALVENLASGVAPLLSMVRISVLAVGKH